MTKKHVNNRYVPVRVDGCVYCFENTAVHSVALGDECTLLPECAPNGLAGEMMYLGSTIPIMRIRTILDTNRYPAPSREHLLIVDIDGSYCGFLVDDVYRARDFSQEDLLPLPLSPDELDHSFYNGIASISETEGYEQAGALILSHHGMLALEQSPPKFEPPSIHTGCLSSTDANRPGKLILFDVSTNLLDQQQVSIGFSATEVIEISQPAELIPIPRSGESLQGLLPWRNQFVPILDLAMRLDIGTTSDEGGRRIAILRSPGHRLMGFFSGANITSLCLPVETQPYAMTNEANNHLIAGTFVTGDGQVLILPSTKNLCDSETPQTAA